MYVGQYFTCYAEAYPAVTMYVLYVNETLLSISSQVQNYAINSAGNYTISCIAFNYIYGKSNPCNSTATINGTAEEAGNYYQQCNEIFCYINQQF